MSKQEKKIHLLPFLHLLLMLGLAVWWGAYFWHHSPSRDLFNLRQPTNRQLAHTSRQPSLMPNLDYLNSSQSSRFVLAARAGLGDLACGGAVFLMLALCSGVYVRRLDTWLNARTSGQAVAFRGQHLTTATLEANAKPQRGVLR